MSRKVKVWIGVGIIVLLFLPGIGLGIRYLVAPAIGMVEKQEKIQSADFRIYSYEHFYDMVVEINTAEQQYKSQHDKLAKVEKGTDIYNRTLANIAALEAHIVKLKNQYNADAAKEETVGIFRANELPEYIEPILPEIK